MITRALILAAGKGAKVGTHAGPNCLAMVGRITLLERTLGLLASVGVQSIAVVVGWGGEAVRAHVAASTRLSPAQKSGITFFENPHWEKPNGLSVQAARPFIVAGGDQRLLLVMADQIAAPALVRELGALPASGADAVDRTVICVDRDLARVFDIDDATKVRLSGDQVDEIGKALRQYQAVSAGLFIMSPTLLAALDGLPEPSLTEGVQAAAACGLVTAHDVVGKLWQDVDSTDMRLHADWLLRVYGDELERPTMQAAPRSNAEDTMALIERLMAEKDQPGHVLFSPGPVMTSARVKAALVHRDVCHRDDDYAAVVERLQEKLRPVFGASAAHETLLITGSGTAAMEMAISSAVPVGKKILVISNGAFGDRLEEIAKLHQLPRVVLRYPWGALPDPADVGRALDSDGEIAVVAMIHHETSVGLLNPVSAVGRLCRDRGVTLIVDAVSALGGEELDVQRDGVDICYSSANKCLHSVSGVSFLCVAPSVWSRIEAIAPRVYYLDMKRHRRYLAELRQTPFTPAVSSFFALETALDELGEQGGVPARRDLYRKRALRIRRVFADLGFGSLTNTGRESHTISTLRLPDFLTVDALYWGLKARGFVIYHCKGALAERYVQVANMGEISDATLDAFLAAVTDVVTATKEAVATGGGGRRRAGAP
ncbi:MAG TPA: aminotransferase class V-fold PLP-dependent enzyme [Polyangia bacterium]|jgi:2-aminoethylphosphonate-pyruvate transaminase|nr:aminotransferase class V-fold PLP-dependent enzyme [Polyangia bacterium]